MSNASESTMLHIRAATMVIINGKTHRRKGQRAKWDRPRESKPCWRDFTVPLSSMHSPGAMKPLGGGHCWPILKFPPGIHSAWKVPHVLPEGAQGSDFATCTWNYLERCAGSAAVYDGAGSQQPFFFFFFFLFFIRKKEKVFWKTSALTLKHVKTKPKGCQKFSNITQECEWALVF